MTLTKDQAHQLLALYKAGAGDESAADDGPDERAEDRWTADELRLAAIFKFAFHLSAIAHADGHPWERDVLEQKVSKIYNVDRADVRAALEIFTRHVPLADWIAAAIDKHHMNQRVRSPKTVVPQQVGA